ncbi:MAG: hypothetical protein V1904_11635, partial [Bacteroidota bacterium]
YSAYRYKPFLKDAFNHERYNALLTDGYGLISNGSAERKFSDDSNEIYIYPAFPKIITMEKQLRER